MFQETIQFFEEAYKKVLSVEGRLEFLNMWYIMIIVNDILIILGSAIKEQIERRVRIHENNFITLLCILYIYFSAINFE